MRLRISYPLERAGMWLQMAMIRATTPRQRVECTRLRMVSSESSVTTNIHFSDVPLISGEWAEVRTVDIGEVETNSSAEGNEHVQVTQLSYFSRMTDAETFEQLAEVGIRRRRVRDAQSMCAVTDGAVWLQQVIDLHRPDGLRILDARSCG